VKEKEKKRGKKKRNNIIKTSLHRRYKKERERGRGKVTMSVD